LDSYVGLTEAGSARPITGVIGKNVYGYQWWTVKPEVGKIHESVFIGRGIHGQYLYINLANNIQINASSLFNKDSLCIIGRIKARKIYEIEIISS